MVDASMVRQGDNALHSGTPQAQLVARGGELWDDMSLSGSGGVACSSCHVNNYGQMQASFAVSHTLIKWQWRSSARGWMKSPPPKWYSSAW
jgi:cytochrome c peroxidase